LKFALTGFLVDIELRNALFHKSSEVCILYWRKTTGQTQFVDLWERDSFQFRILDFEILCLEYGYYCSCLWTWWWNPFLPPY